MIKNVHWSLRKAPKILVGF